MIVEYIRYTIGDNRADAFVADYAKASEVLASSPYCENYELTRCEEEPTSFILRIVWKSTADHLEGFRKSAEFPAFFALIKPYFHDIQEMRHYALTSVLGKGGGA